MYLPYKGGTKEIIQGYTCHIPPPPDDKSEILNYHLPKGKQIWVRSGLPSYWEERREEEIYYQEKEQRLVDEGALKMVTHKDQVLEKFRRKEWFRRLYGIHIMMNGTLYYLTGTHYFYLQWIKSDHAENEGYPLYYDHQRRRFYFRELCRQDPYCLGYVIIGGRGFGKTTEEMAVILEDITRPPTRRNSAIQSKNKDDAKDIIFKEKAVPIFNSLPDFFKPEYNHGSDPENRFSFKREKKTGKGARKVKFGDEYELSNYLYPKPAKETALDGGTYANIFNDEIGKTDPKKVADAHKRIEVNVRCVYRNDRKIGLLRATTTVEEMEEGGAECEKVWDESNPDNETRDLNGYTVSKLYRYFVSAVETKAQFSDKFGFIDEKKAEQFLLNARVPVKDQPKKLASLMRKDPITIEEAFITDANKCMFHVFILTERIKQLRAMPKLPGRVGNLIYKNGELDTEVVFVDDPTGDFIIYHYPERSEGMTEFRRSRKILNALQSKTINGKTEWFPVNDDLYSGGLDPIKSVRTEDPRASKLAGFGFRRFDPLVDEDDEAKIPQWRSHNIMWRYLARHDDPDDDFENMIKAVRFFGHSIMPENNVTDLTKHFKNRGYKNCLIVRRDFDQTVFEKNPQSKTAQEEPVTSTPEAMNAYIRRIQSYVVRHGMRIPDLELLKQLKNFDPKKPTAYDLVIAFGYTLLSLDRIFKEQKFNVPYENPFDLYDQSGTRSREIDPREIENYNQNTAEIDDDY